MALIREVILWLETRVRDLGFDPQRLELTEWQRLHRELEHRDSFETSTRIRQALALRDQQRWP